jgi:hypothetical protein
MSKAIAGYSKLSAKERLAEAKEKDELALQEKEEAKTRVAKKTARLRALRLGKESINTN